MIEFTKQNINLALFPKRNLCGDLTIGWNRATHIKDERTTPEIADVWLAQDLLKAQKFVAKFGLDKHEPIVFLAFYVGNRRWRELEPLLKLIEHGERIKAALTLTNSKWMTNNPNLGAHLAKKIIANERTL